MKLIQSLIDKNKKGLTLIELLVVILIMAILLVALVPRLSSVFTKAKETQVRTDFRNFSIAAESVLREYVGFAGLPLRDENNKTLATIGEKFWKNNEDLEEAEGTAVTQSIIKAMNRYLETNYHFGDKATSLDFGKCKATDPWERPYEIYFVSRDKSQEDDLNTDKIYVVCNGKTLNRYYPDYLMICEYKNGEVRTQTSGFGEALSTEFTVFSGKSNGDNYTLIGSVFRNDCKTSGLNIPKDYSEVDPPEIGTDTIFDFNKPGGNKERLFIESTSRPILSLEAAEAAEASDD